MLCIKGFRGLRRKLNAGCPMTKVTREGAGAKLAEDPEKVYRVENPDGIQPASDKSPLLMRYATSHIPAATWFEAPAGYKVAAFGFPLETSAQMPEVIQAVLRKFEGK